MSIHKIVLNTDTLFHFFTCAPTSYRGKDSLKSLGLSDVSEEFFFSDKGFYVATNFNSNSELQLTDNPIPDAYETGHPFSRNNEAIRQKRNAKSVFNSKFFNRADYLLEISAAPGNGKTTEIHYLIRTVPPDIADKFVLDLEALKSAVPFGPEGEFEIPVPLDGENYKLWLFYTALLFELKNLIIDRVRIPGIGSVIMEAFTCYFNSSTDIKKKIATKEIIDCFKAITADTDDNSFLSGLWFSFKNLINEKDPVKSIKKLFKITLWLLFCIDSKKMNFIIIDNIERYVKSSDGAVITWYDEDVRLLSTIFEIVIGDTKTDFETIDLSFTDYFKFISVLRSTSMYASLQTDFTRETCSFDISNSTNFYELYRKRRKTLFPLLVFQDSELIRVNNVFRILDIIVSDDEALIDGHSFLEMISSFCNGNIRRIAAMISSIVISLEEILVKMNNCIDIETFCRLWNNPDNKFLMRRAVLQYAIMQVVRTENFKNLNMCTPDNTTISKETVGIFMRRVLVFLSRRHRDNKENESFVTLLELVRCAFINEKREKPELTIERDFLPFSRVLCALNQPSFKNTRTTPWIIIRFNKDGIIDANELAKALENVWRENSCDKYPINNFGARITRAGHLFVSTIHPDYSLFAAIHCNDMTPLMFVNHAESAKSQIEKVYSAVETYISTLNEVDKGFFGAKDLAAQKTQIVGIAKVKREHLFMRKEGYEVTLQEQIVYRVHQYLIHYQRFLNSEVNIYQKGSIALLKRCVTTTIIKLEDLFKTLNSNNHIVSTNELFSFNQNDTV